MSQIPFRSVRRGYEPQQVDEAVASLNKELEAERSKSSALESDHGKHQEQTAELTREVESLKQRLSQTQRDAGRDVPPTFADLGDRIGSMLTLAKEECDEMLDRARTEASTVEADANKRAQGVIGHAEREAADVMTRTQADAAKYLEDARQRADAILERADEEAMTRRGEAEAVFESQRAKAAAAAAEFERSLADRRKESAEEFTKQAAQQEEQLRVNQAHLNSIRAEAEHLEKESREQADATIRDARTQAEQIMSSAKDRAEQIRTNSERELAAATARRDSITAQLANVRQMLSTLGGPVAEQLGNMEVAEEPAPKEKPNKWKPVENPGQRQDA